MKRRKPQQKNFDELVYRGGIVKSSDWINGRGRWVTSRAIPPGAKKFDRQDATLGLARENVVQFFAAHPRVQAVIAVTEV